MRKRMITRNIVITKVTTMNVDIDTAEVTNEVYELTNTYKNEKSILKELEKRVPANIKIVQIVDTSTITKMYGMPEADFIASASELTPDRKVLSNENESEE